MPYQIFLDKNLNPSLFVWVMDFNSTQTATKAAHSVDFNTADIVFLDSDTNYLSLTESETYSGISKHTLRAKCDKNEIEHIRKKDRYTNNSIYIHKQVLDELKVNQNSSQSKTESSELISTLSATVTLLQEQLKVKDEQIAKLLENEQATKKLLENQQSLTLQIQNQLQLQSEEKSAQKNTSKKRFWGLFGDSD